MYKYYWRVFSTSFTSQLVMYIRPLINIIPFILFSYFIFNDYKSYLVIGSYVFFIQLDLIIIPNYRYYILERDNKTYDFILSKQGIKKMIFMESIFYVSYLVIQLFLLTLYILGLKSALLIVFACFISQLIGYSMLFLTKKFGDFRYPSRIGMFALTTGLVYFPLIILPKWLQYICMLNIYTPIMELVRNINYSNLTVFSSSVCIIMIFTDLLLYIIIFYILKKRLLNKVI